jgi:hypothetical protein
MAGLCTKKTCAPLGCVQISMGNAAKAEFRQKKVPNMTLADVLIT